MLVEWLDIQSACSLLQRSYRSVVRYVQMGKLQARKVPNPNGGRGGFRYQILLPSLPPEAQQRYWQIVRESRQVEEARPKRGRPRKVREVEAQEEEAQANALSQLSRSLESRADKRPMLSDLRESGSDIVLFLFRPDYYAKGGQTYGNLAELSVAKNRNGPVGGVKLLFYKEFGSFADAPDAGEQARRVIPQSAAPR